MDRFSHSCVESAMGVHPCLPAQATAPPVVGTVPDKSNCLEGTVRDQARALQEASIVGEIQLNEDCHSPRQQIEDHTQPSPCRPDLNYGGRADRTT